MASGIQHVHAHGSRVTTKVSCSRSPCDRARIDYLHPQAKVQAIVAAMQNVTYGAYNDVQVALTDGEHVVCSASIVPEGLLVTFADVCLPQWCKPDRRLSFSFTQHGPRRSACSCGACTGRPSRRTLCEAS